MKMTTSNRYKAQADRAFAELKSRYDERFVTCRLISHNRAEVEVKWSDTVSFRGRFGMQRGRFVLMRFERV